MESISPAPTAQGSRLGAVAQLGERRNGIAKVRGSIPLGSTIPMKNSHRFLLFYRAVRLSSHIIVPRGAALLWNGLARFLSPNPETQRDLLQASKSDSASTQSNSGITRSFANGRVWAGSGSRLPGSGFRVPVAPSRHRCAKLLMAGSGPYRKSDLPPPKHRFACFPTVRFPGPAGKKQTSYQHRYGVPEVMPQDRKQQAAGPEPQPDGDERGKRRQGHGECVEGELTVRESEGVRHAEQKA